MTEQPHETKIAETSISRAADRKNQYYSLLYTEMAERKRVEENLRRSNLLLQGLSQAQLQYVAGTDLALVFASLLRILLAATQAQQGYLREQNVIADLPTSSGLTIQEGLVEPANTDHFVEIAERVLHSGQPVLLHPAKQDNATLVIASIATPAYYLGLPITITPLVPISNTPTGTVSSENIVGVIVIAGRAEEFDPATFELMQPLVSTCAQLIVAHRNDVRRRHAELALAEERMLLADRVAARTAELSYSNAELARAARAKDEFLATMNHELRTPLNAVLLYAESLLTQLPGPLNDRQLRAVSGIRESAHHLLLLINDILDVAKMDAGKLNLDIVTASVETICQSSLRLVSEMALKKHLELTYNCNPLATLLDVDERRLKQMLVNLLSNAVKFTPEGGKVGLDVEGDIENGVLHFTVWDTGIGLSQEDIKKLFQPFVQIDSSHSRHHGGTGLGLFLVYRMAELHGGSIAVTSEVQQGSRFTISLPWQPQSYSPSDEARMAVNGRSLVPRLAVNRTEAKLTASKPADRQPPTTPAEQATAGVVTAQKLAASFIEPIPSVLIVDDNETNLHVLSDFLQEWRCRILMARTGVEAVQQTKEEHPDLVFMDIQMPEMNGLDAIRLIRAEPSLQKIPIVALTALAMPGDREQCLAAGANDYISKPIQIARLTEVLNTHLQNMHLNSVSGKKPL